MNKRERLDQLGNEFGFAAGVLFGLGAAILIHDPFKYYAIPTGICFFLISLWNHKKATQLSRKVKG